jgi:2-polyprenyl-6-methoxyphenol hydroxylase-like FAD-dependent oxidoreductase
MFDSPGSWDVIVVGASFAGLAAALELVGTRRVLVIDRDPVGEGQTSACATPLVLLERLDLLDSVEQVHDHGVWLCGVSPLSWPAESAYWAIANPELTSEVGSPAGA